MTPGGGVILPSGGGGGYSILGGGGGGGGVILSWGSFHPPTPIHLGEKMQVDKFFLIIDLALIRLLLINLHFFIATIQIGVIVQVCYTPRAELWCVTYT